MTPACVVVVVVLDRVGDAAPPWGNPIGWLASTPQPMVSGGRCCSFDRSVGQHSRSRRPRFSLSPTR